jgi:hypothetical protein
MFETASVTEGMPFRLRFLRSACANGKPCFHIETGTVFITMDVEAFQAFVARANELLQSGPEPDPNPKKES